MSRPAPLQNNFDGGQRQDDSRNRPANQSSWTFRDFIRDYGAPARGRGGWAFYSSAVSAQTASASYTRGGVYANFATTAGGVNPKNLVIDEDGILYSIASATATLIGAAKTIIQNPVFHGGTSVSGATAIYSGLVIIPDGTGAAVPKKYDGASISDLRGLPPKARYAAVYKNYTVLANGTASASTATTGTQIYFPARLWFSRIGDPEAAFSGTATTSWDLDEGWIDFSETIKGLGATKNALLVFHEGGTISRIRGSTAPPAEDMEVDDPFLTLGLLDPFSITTYKDNVYWCAPEGIFRSDGVVIDDITKKGGMLRYWLDLCSAQSVSSYTFATGVVRDYLFVAIMNGTSFVDAFMVDLQSYVFTRLSNMKAISFWSGAINAADDTFFSHRSDTRVGRLDSIFSNVGTTAGVTDGDGTAVTPTLETNFFEMGMAGLKRVRKVYIGYELDDLTSANPTVAVSYIKHPEDTGYTTAGTLSETTTYKRVAIPLNQRVPGIALKLAQSGAGDFHLHDIEIEALPQEGSSVPNRNPRPEANRPETYLNPQERAQLQRLLGFPEEFPQKFLAWLQDYLRVNIPQFPVTQIHGMQNFTTLLNALVNGTGPNFKYIDAKGDLIVGFADDTITVLPVGTDNYVLTADSAQPSGIKWAASAASAGTSNHVAEIQATSPGLVLATGDGQGYFLVSDNLNGLNLIDADAFVTTVSTAGTPTIQIRNSTASVDMLSTRITIDANQHTSYTAATPPVIDTGADGVSTGDLLAIDVDVAGTGTKGLGVVLTFG